MKQAPLLVELGTEELPARMVDKLSRAWVRGMEEALDQARLQHGPLHGYATPRRLAVYVENVDLKQPDQLEERIGPPRRLALDDQGHPTAAARGFAARLGVAVEALEMTTVKNEERLLLRRNLPGGQTSQLLPELLAQALRSLPTGRWMRWSEGDEVFLRPARWLLALLGERVVPAQLLGCASDRISHGHPLLHPGPLTLKQASEYLEVLARQGCVLADPEQRRQIIREQVAQQAAGMKAKAHLDEALITELIHLVEWPQVLTGSFDPEFLKLPSEVLISCMQTQQKYIPLAAEQDGTMLPRFLLVSNLGEHAGEAVVRGNERVIRPRLADARFFLESDLGQPLDQRLEALGGMVFHSRLGTLHDKSRRLETLARTVAAQLGSNPDHAGRAGLLAKCDQACIMVQEFPTLQGVMGMHYARAGGEPEAVALALAEQYLPRFATDQVPQSATGCALTLADRADTLIGMFAAGEVPTGSRDPLGLRRTALGLLRTCLEQRLEMDWRWLLKSAAALYPESLHQAAAQAQTALDEFLRERLRVHCLEQGIGSQTFQAVAALDSSRPLDMLQRLQALESFARQPACSALASAHKRVGNLLRSQREEALKTGSLSTASPTTPPTTPLREPAELALAKASEDRDQFQDEPWPRPSNSAASSCPPCWKRPSTSRPCSCSPCSEHRSTLSLTRSW